MVKGLNIFRDRFRQFEGSLTLIGGAACDEWFRSRHPECGRSFPLSFR
jgi:hypothetical protein